MSHFYAGWREWISSEANQKPGSSNREFQAFRFREPRSFHKANVVLPFAFASPHQTYANNKINQTNSQSMKPSPKSQFISVAKIRSSRQWLLLVWLMLAFTTGVSHKAVAQNCVNATQYPAPFTSPIKGAGPNQITVQQYQQEYNQMTGALAGSAFQSTASIAGTWITVRAGSVAGAIVAQGSTPLNWTASAGGTYFINYNTNSLCGTANTNMTSTVENTTPVCANTVLS